MRILHCFADEGVESEALSAYGEVIRVGLDPKDTNQSEPIQADAKQLPFKESVNFDLGLFHPPCQKFSVATQGKTESHENLIPLARRLGGKYCDEWIIENVPQAPLNDPVRLNGGMFGLPLHYERCFEMSYHVDQPRDQTRIGKPRFSSHHESGRFQGSKQLWKSVKGYGGDYCARSLKRAGIPRAYINYLVRPLLD